MQNRICKAYGFLWRKRRSQIKTKDTGSKSMSGNEKYSGSGIVGAINAERQALSKTDPAVLNKTLMKSPAWKRNAFRRIENAEAGDNTHSHIRATLARQSEKIDQLRQSIAKLRAENAGLTDRHERELSELQAAYNQFEQQSDELLAEMDQKNERLMLEIKQQNPRSLL